MNERDELLNRVTKANPVPHDAELPNDVVDSRPPLGLLISKEGAPSPDVRPPQSAHSERRWRGPLVAAGTAVAILVVIAASLLLLRTGQGEVADQSIDPVPTTIAPTVNGVVPGVWDPILATTKATAAPPAATCPDGATPDVPGSVDQARPYGGSWSNQAATFDQHAGRIVFVDEVGETWTFDVCTNTWHAMNPNFDTPGLFRDSWAGQLVYDVDSDLTISFLGDVLAVYDADANAWTSRSQPEEYDTFMPGLGAVYDPVSGLVVVQTTSSGLVAYDVETDMWTPIGGIEDKEWPSYLIGYLAETDRLVRLNVDNDQGTLVDDDHGTVIDPRTAVTTEFAAPFDVFAAFRRLDYATNTDTPYLVDPLAIDATICRLAPTTYEWDCLNLADGPGSVATSEPGLLAATVGDPINGRVILIYGYGRGGDGSSSYHRDEVWAVDFDTDEWTQLLSRSGDETSDPGED